MRIIDISLPLGASTPVYPGDPPVELHRLSEADGRDGYALSRLSLGSHTGTHIDPPAHFVPGGATVDEAPLDACIGPVFVIDLSGGRGPIEPDELDGLPSGSERVLLKTGGPPLGGRALGAAAARWLVERRIRLAGIDTLSVAPTSAPGEVHRILLSAGVVILEGLDLSAVPAGAATLICLPLKLTGGDGAPARAALLVED